MKKIFFILGLILSSQFSFADETVEEIWIMSVISSESEVLVNEKIELDWNQSLVRSWEGADFSWSIEWTEWELKWEKIEHIFDKLWKQMIVLTIKQWESISKTQKEIFVYNKKITLITELEEETKIREMKNQASEKWIFLQVISLEDSWSNFINTEEVIKKLIENKKFIEESTFIIFETENFNWIETFKKFWESLELESQIKLAEKFYIKISEWNLKIDKNITEKYFKKWLKPENALITRKEAFMPIYESNNIIEVKNILERRWIELIELTEEWKALFIFILSNFITELVNEWVSLNTIYMILSLPFITFFVVFFRQVIWLSTFWVYIPTITALSFFILWIKSGLIIIAFVVLSSYIIRNVLNKIELPFIPKAALMLSLISLSFFLLFWISISFNAKIPIELAIFPMLVVSTIAEKFIWSQSTEGMQTAFLNMWQTILISVISFVIVNTNFIYNLIISFPELVVIPLLLSIAIWRFTWLRISEYIKFRNLLKEGVEE